MLAQATCLPVPAGGSWTCPAATTGSYPQAANSKGLGMAIYIATSLWPPTTAPQAYRGMIRKSPHQGRIATKRQQEYPTERPGPHARAPTSHHPVISGGVRSRSTPKGNPFLAHLQGRSPSPGNRPSKLQGARTPPLVVTCKAIDRQDRVVLA